MRYTIHHATSNEKTNYAFSEDILVFSEIIYVFVFLLPSEINSQYRNITGFYHYAKMKI